MNRLSTLVIALLSASGAEAQDLDWTYRATIYGWLPPLSASVETAFGAVETETSASDVLENLDLANMGNFSARRGRLCLVADLLYTDLSTEQGTPSFGFSSGIVDLRLTALSTYALYRVSTDPKLLFDLGVGFRIFDMRTDVALSAGGLPAASQSIDATWTDPLIAARVATPLNEDWFLTGFADVGGSGSESNTCQVHGGVGYNFNECWSSQIDYRYMDINKEISGRDVSFGLSGVVFAPSYTL